VLAGHKLDLEVSARDFATESGHGHAAVQNVALFAVHAQRSAAARDRGSPIDSQPGFTKLLPAGEDR